MAGSPLKDDDVLQVVSLSGAYETGRIVQGKKPHRILTWIIEGERNQRTVGEYRAWRRGEGLSGENDGLGGYLPTFIKKGIVKVVSS